MPGFWKSLAASVLIGQAATGVALAESSMDRSAPRTAQSGEAAILRSLQTRSLPLRQPDAFGGNVASVTQLGDRNRSTIVQTGGSNLATVAILGGSDNHSQQTQTGSRNVSKVQLNNGRNNSVQTTQVGNDNGIAVELTNTENVQIEWLQKGNGINSSAQPIVIQRDSAVPMPIVIQQSN